MKCSCSSGSSYNEKSEGKKKGRPRVEVQELRIIPVSKAIHLASDEGMRLRQIGILGDYLWKE